MANRKAAITGEEYIRVTIGAVEWDISPAQLISLIGGAAAADLAALTATVTAQGNLHLSGAGVPVDYTDGTPPATGEGVAPEGALYSDTTNGLVYRNSGTLAEPIWTDLADAVI